METLDVRGVGPEGLRHLKNLVEFYRRQHRTPSGPAIGMIRKRRVDPSEFVPRKTKLKGKLTRALAYED